MQQLIRLMRLTSTVRLMAIGVVVSASLAVAQTPFFQAEVPADLRPLLVPRQSEMRLVVRRYTLDRQALESNYAGSLPRIGAGSAFAGTGDLTTPPPAPAISPARLSRLKRFDRELAQALIGVADVRRPPMPARNRSWRAHPDDRGNLAEIEKQALCAGRDRAAACRSGRRSSSLVEARIRLRTSTRRRRPVC